MADETDRRRDTQEGGASENAKQPEPPPAAPPPATEEPAAAPSPSTGGQKPASTYTAPPETPPAQAVDQPASAQIGNAAPATADTGSPRSADGTGSPSKPQDAAVSPQQHHPRGPTAIDLWGLRIAVIALTLSTAAFLLDYNDRVEERTVRAWQLLTTPAPGNSGKIQALEYLNREDGLICGEWTRPLQVWREEWVKTECLLTLKARTPLVGIDLSSGNNGTPDNPNDDPQGAYLLGVNLNGANLRGADLRNVSLTHAELFLADLSAANLRGADLTDAILRGAVLTDADLTDADLSGALYLTQEQLNTACGDKDTKLPDGLTIPMCDEVGWWVTEETPPAD